MDNDDYQQTEHNIMFSESTTPSLWFVEPSEVRHGTSKSTTLDHRAIRSYYPYSSVYKAEVLINGHLRRYWNTCWTKVVAVNELIIGLLLLVIGVLIVSFQLSLAFTAHGIWTGALAFLAGLFAFFTIIYRRHRFFLLVAVVHIITGLASTVLIFISVFAIALEMNDNSPLSNSTLISNIKDHQLNFGLHVTLIVLGLYEKLLCYTFLIMIIRHTHKMV